jgi:hypothetical protein
VVVLAFTIARGVYRTVFGIQFDPSPVSFYVQYIDPWFIEHDFARSLLYLHHQAPLQNLLVGLPLRLFTASWAYLALEILYVVLGLAIVLGVLHVMLRLGVRPAVAVITSSLYAISPTTALYENWLFYHVPVTFCLGLSLVFLLRFYRLGTHRAGFWFFAAIAMAALFRSTLGPLFLAAIVALVMLRPPTTPRGGSGRKMVLRAAAIPFIVLLLNSCKPSLLLGYGYGEVMFWGNLSQKISGELGERFPAERQRLLNEGKISQATMIFCLTDLRDFGRLRVPHEPKGVPLLDLDRTPNGRWNAHAFEYLLLARKYYKPDALYLISHYPGVYIQSVWHALSWYASSATKDGMLARTKNYLGVRNLVETINRWSGKGKGDRLLALLIGLPLAFAYGLYRLVRSRYRREGQRTSVIAIAYMLLTISYATCVSTMVSWGDFSRYRFEIDPFYLVLLAALLSDVSQRVPAAAKRIGQWMRDFAARRLGIAWVVERRETGHSKPVGFDDQLARPERSVAGTPPPVDSKQLRVLRLAVGVVHKLRALAGSGLRGISRERIVVRFCLGVWGIVIVALLLATLSRELSLVRTGDQGQAYPLPYYGVLLTELATGPAIPGNDFSQVYASAASLRRGGSAYHPANWRGGRPGYPPLANWLYVPVAGFPFDVAILFQHAVSLLALAGATITVLWKTGLRRHIWRVSLAQMALYFLTPIGLTHFERGQFDLLVATGVLLCYGCVFLPGSRFGTAALSGFLGAIKWSAPIFLGGFSLLAFLLGIGKRRWAFFLIPVVTVAVTLCFWRELPEYWVSIKVWELDMSPSGITFHHLLPRAVVRALPLLVPTVLAALVWVRVDRREARVRVLRSISFPVALTLVIQSICFSRLSFEYHTVTLLAMIPAIVVWIDREHCVTAALKAFTALSFGLLLLVTFRVFGFSNRFDSAGMTRVYAFFAMLFFLESVYIVWFTEHLGWAERNSHADKPFWKRLGSGPRDEGLRTDGHPVPLLVAIGHLRLLLARTFRVPSTGMSDGTFQSGKWGCAASSHPASPSRVEVWRSLSMPEQSDNLPAGTRLVPPASAELASEVSRVPTSGVTEPVPTSQARLAVAVAVGRLFDWLLLRNDYRRAQAAAKSTLPAQAEAFELAHVYVQAAESLLEVVPDVPVAPVLGLLRDAMLWSLTPDGSPRRLREIFEGAPESVLMVAAGGVNDMSRLRALATRPIIELATRIPAEEQLAIALAARKWLRAYLAQTDAGSVRRVSLRRRLRVLAVAVLGLVASIVVVYGISSCLTVFGDLARNKPWVQSSQWWGGTSPPGMFFHTNDEPNPWIRYDLGAPTPVHRLLVKNRTDCCSERAVPLVVEVSSDLVNWDTVARQNTNFETWEPSFPTVKARYVRLRLDRVGTLHLAMVRMY